MHATPTTPPAGTRRRTARDRRRRRRWTRHQVGSPGHPEVELNPRQDMTDVYAFPGSSPRRIVLVMNSRAFHPGQPPDALDPDFLYQFKVDNDGDAREDRVIQVTFTGSGAEQQVQVRGPVAPPVQGAMMNEVADVSPVLSGATNTSLGTTDLQVFAGPRDDPFFLDLEAAFASSPTGNRSADCWRRPVPSRRIPARAVLLPQSRHQLRPGLQRAVHRGRAAELDDREQRRAGYLGERLGRWTRPHRGDDDMCGQRNPLGRKRRRWALTLTITVVAFAAAACSDDNGDGGNGPPSRAPTTRSATRQPAGERSAAVEAEPSHSRLNRTGRRRGAHRRGGARISHRAGQRGRALRRIRQHPRWRPPARHVDRADRQVIRLRRAGSTWFPPARSPTGMAVASSTTMSWTCASWRCSGDPFGADPDGAAGKEALTTDNVGTDSPVLSGPSPTSERQLSRSLSFRARARRAALGAAAAGSALSCRWARARPGQLGWTSRKCWSWTSRSSKHESRAICSPRGITLSSPVSISSAPVGGTENEDLEQAEAHARRRCTV